MYAYMRISSAGMRSSQTVLHRVVGFLRLKGTHEACPLSNCWGEWVNVLVVDKPRKSRMSVQPGMRISVPTNLRPSLIAIAMAHHNDNPQHTELDVGACVLAARPDRHIRES